MVNFGVDKLVICWGLGFKNRQLYPCIQGFFDTHGEAHYSTCILLAGISFKMEPYGSVQISMEYNME